MANLTRKTLSGPGAEVLANRGKKYLAFVERLPEFFDDPVFMHAYRNALGRRNFIYADGSELKVFRAPIDRITATVPETVESGVVSKRSSLHIAIRVYDAAGVFQGHIMSPFVVNGSALDPMMLSAWTFVPSAIQIRRSKYQTAGLYEESMVCSVGNYDYWEVSPNGVEANNVVAAKTYSSWVALTDTRVYTYRDTPPDVGMMDTATGGVTTRMKFTPWFYIDSGDQKIYDVGEQIIDTTLTDNMTYPGDRYLVGSLSTTTPVFFLISSSDTPAVLADPYAGSYLSMTGEVGRSLFAKSTTEFFCAFTEPTTNALSMSVARSSAEAETAPPPPHYTGYGIFDLDRDIPGTVFHSSWFPDESPTMYLTTDSIQFNGAAMQAVYNGHKHLVDTIVGKYTCAFQTANYYDAKLKAGLLMYYAADTTTPAAWKSATIAVVNDFTSVAMTFPLDPTTGKCKVATHTTLGDLFVQDITLGAAVLSAVTAGTLPV